MMNWVTNFNMFQMYKRMWYPDTRTPKCKIDDGRINVLQDCQFITLTPVGIGLTGITGDMDDAIATLGLYNVIGAALPKMVNYAKSIAPPIKERITEVAFITAFNKTADKNGGIMYALNGVVHTDARLIPAITQIL